MGRIIAVEGIDGSGKGTQSKLVHSRLIELGYSAEFRSYPQYEQSFFGREVGSFLNGEFGTLDQVHPKLAALLYAGDRFESASKLSQEQSQFDFIICDRYTPSNIAHQSAKISNLRERIDFENWVYELENKVFSIPMADDVVLLDVDPQICGDLIEKKDTRSYTNEKRDLHESDMDYLRSVREAYLGLAAKNNWIVIECIVDGQLLAKIDIRDRIIESLSIASGSNATSEATSLS